MSLHPAFRAYLDELNPLIEANARAGVEATPESARAALAGLNQFALPVVEIDEIFDTAVTYGPEATDGADGSAAASMPGPVRVPVRVYVPRPGVPSDVIAFVHGGGHMAGDLEVYDFSARRVAAATGMVVVSVDYRRSPEAPFPAGLTDTYQAVRHLTEVLVGVATTEQVYAVADSGGAAKVASIAMRTTAGDWSSPISRQVLLYPSLDYTLSGPSVDDLGTGYFLEADRVRWYFDHYFAADDDREGASPLSGPFGPGMPETLVIAAEYDPLISEAELYVERMVAAGASARLIVAPGMIHAFAFFETKVPEMAARLYEVIAEFLRTGDARW
ncbi:alpha/beta hydrolase [Raineyella sp. W15-4]|uniref:alpha/beta hydrolase n=1 Tax=Raineyella sp. W15-4 TaxID=3081651 RepID=UPI002953BA87|nr:alpha/beta hydrolase [Raineyella sp. W15-4]WOQ15752.1 alpha/beta hydrolase [Raineyella sp. W15-4]